MKKHLTSYIATTAYFGFLFSSENVPTCPIEFLSVGHVNIVVDDIEKATAFYGNALGAKPVQDFPHFRNIGFAKSAGFMENPQEVDVTIRFLVLPTPEHFHLELMEYHLPKGNTITTPFQTHDRGGVRHIALRVHHIDQAFLYLKTVEGVKMISSSPEYLPYKIDAIATDEFRFFDPVLEADEIEKQKVCDIVGGIRYFYFIDPYGVQWELEQGHEDIGSNT